MTATEHAGAAPVGAQVRAQARMELRLLMRNGESVLIAFGIPLGVLVFLGRVVPVSLGDGRPLDALVPGVLALAVMSTAFTAQAIQTGFQRKYGVLKRLGTTPLSRPAFLAAKVVAVLSIVVVQAAAVIGLAAALGWRWSPGSSVLVLAVGLVLGTATFAAMGLLIAGALKAELTLALSNAVYLVLVAAGSQVFGETGSVAARVALALPSGALARLFAGALPASADAGNLGVLPGLVLLGWLVVAGVLASRLFRWEP